jgi:hypothetical protein
VPKELSDVVNVKEWVETVIAPIKAKITSESETIVKVGGVRNRGL